MTVPSQFISNCVHEVARSEGFVDYEIESTDGSKHGDNFLGIMTAIKVCGTCRKNGVSTKKELYLICKAPPLGEIRKKSWKSSRVFDREIYMYTKLLPDFVEFQREKGLSDDESFLSFPKVLKCFISEEFDTQLLIMEDLRSKNFTMWPKEKMIDLEHELLVLKEVAKFHAVSFAMRDQRPDKFKKYETELTDIAMEIIFSGSIGKFIAQSFDRFIDALDNPDHKKLTRNFRTRYLDTINEFLTGPTGADHAVIRHGDCWNNNFMFQYNENQDLQGISLLDWQLSHFCAPVLDVMYNIFSSTDTEFRELHYETLLNTYYTTLCDMMKKLGSDPNKLYPYDIFQMQLKKFGEYALLMVPLIILIRVAKHTDVSNLDDFAKRSEQGEDVQMVGTFTGETQREYCRLVNGLVTDLVKYGYIRNE